MKRIVIIALALALPLLATACNTVQGAGEDLQGGGHAISTGAEKTKNAIEGN